MTELPGLVPGSIVSIIAGVAAGGIVGRLFHARRAVAVLMIVGFGVIASATLTPFRPVEGHAAGVRASCDFSRITLAPLSRLLAPTDASANVLMFLPLGLAIGLLPGTRRKAIVVGAAVALPFAIETIQLVAVPLNRACESADVVDNLTGLAVGLAMGATSGRLIPRLGRGALAER